MHKHKEKDEVFYLQSGKVLLEVAGKEHTMKPGDFIHIRAGDAHRFTGLEDSEIFEFSTTHSEDDSYRSTVSGHVDEERYERQSDLIHSFKDAKVLVLGDVMLDTYVEGAINRISPEAPIPIVRYEASRHVPGGAANAARNVVSLGGKAILIGVRGSDEPGRTLESLLKKEKVRSDLITDRGRCTTEKQRLTGGNDHQMLRVDYEHTHFVPSDVHKKILEKYKKHLKEVDVVLLSDYAKGVFTSTLLEKCISLAKKAKKPVLLDPKPQDSSYLSDVRGVSLLLPNRREAQILVDDASDAMEEIGVELVRAVRGDVLLTLGEGGMILIERSGEVHAFPALASGVIDVSGAGDTVAAACALTLASDGALPDAADIANRAASVVVMEPGTAVVDREELLGVL